MLKTNGREQHAYLCLSVGALDDNEDISDSTELMSSRPIAEWVDHPVVSIPCNDTANIIEWIFVPFIEDEFVESEDVEAGIATDRQDPGLEDASTKDLASPTCVKQ